MDIIEEIGMEAALGQLAEEAAELAQAALKLQRILHGTNPTPVTLEEAKAALIEESVDVDICLAVIGEADQSIRFDADLQAAKKERWMRRIEEARHE